MMNGGEDRGTLGPTAPAGGYNWLRLPNGSFEHVGLGSLGESPDACVGRITPNAGHVIFRTGCSSGATAQLEPGAPASGTIYDRSPGGPTYVVSRLPNETITTGTYLGSSTDGSAVAFTSGPSLLVRLNNSATLPVTSSADTYAGIAGDGSAVFYLQAGDLYRFDTGTQTSTQVTTGGGVTVVNVPEDGNHAYFVSQQDLDGGGGGTLGQNNLYYWDGSSIGFIGIVDTADLTLANDGSGQSIPSLARWVAAETGINTRQPALHTSRTSPDGTTIAFQSKAQLTNFANSGKIEIYRFEIGDVGPSCVSCDPNGETPVSDAAFLAFGGGNATRDFAADVKNLSDDGRTVTFQTGDALEASDSNGKQDVYRWTKGRGIELISSGTGAFDTHLYDVTGDAHDIFIAARETLVPNDFNAGAPAIYDARVDGGLASQHDSPSECTGDQCQGSPTLPPADQGSGSSTLNGPGNQGKDHTVATPTKKCGKSAKAEEGQVREEEQEAQVRAGETTTTGALKPMTQTKTNSQPPPSPRQARPAGPARAGGDGILGARCERRLLRLRAGVDERLGNQHPGRSPSRSDSWLQCQAGRNRQPLGANQERQD